MSESEQKSEKIKSALSIGLEVGAFNLSQIQNQFPEFFGDQSQALRNREFPEVSTQVLAVQESKTV